MNDARCWRVGRNAVARITGQLYARRAVKQFPMTAKRYRFGLAWKLWKDGDRRLITASPMQTNDRWPRCTIPVMPLVTRCTCTISRRTTDWAITDWPSPFHLPFRHECSMSEIFDSHTLDDSSREKFSIFLFRSRVDRLKIGSNEI